MATNTAEYRTLKYHTNDLRLAVKGDLTYLSGALLAMDLVTKGESDNLRSTMRHSEEDRAAQLIGLIQDKVLENTVNYDKFITVLQNQDRTQYRDILHRLEVTYNDLSQREGSRRQLYSSSSAGDSFELEQPPGYQRQRSWVSGTASRPSSFEQEMSLDENPRENDSDDDTQSSMIAKNLETIKDQFAKLLSRLRAAFDGVDITKVHQYLTDTLQREIPLSPDLQSIFSFLSLRRLWTYQHYDLVEKLNNHFLQCDKSIKQHILVYKSRLAGYFTARKIIKSEFFIDSTSSYESTTQSVTEYSDEHRKSLSMRLHLQRKMTDECLKYVADLWESFAEEFELPSVTAVIDSIVKKCLEITWLILPCDAEKITPAIAAKHSCFFDKHAITLVTIDDIIIYEKDVPIEQATQQLGIHKEELSTGGNDFELKQMELCRQLQESLPAADSSIQTVEKKVLTVQSKEHGLEGELQELAEEVPDPCLNYSLFGKCSFGARCKHQHIRSLSSPVTVYIQAKYLKYPPTRYYEYKERNPTTHKGFVILPSEKEPTKEIKVVAEDHETADYAQRRLPAIIPGKMKSMKRECIDKKLFGRCRNKSCTYKHGGIKPIER